MAAARAELEAKLRAEMGAEIEAAMALRDSHARRAEARLNAAKGFAQRAIARRARLMSRGEGAKGEGASVAEEAAMAATTEAALAHAAAEMESLSCGVEATATRGNVSEAASTKVGFFEGFADGDEADHDLEDGPMGGLRLGEVPAGSADAERAVGADVVGSSPGADAMTSAVATAAIECIEPPAILIE